MVCSKSVVLIAWNVFFVFKCSKHVYISYVYSSVNVMPQHLPYDLAHLEKPACKPFCKPCAHVVSHRVSPCGIA